MSVTGEAPYGESVGLHESWVSNQQQDKSDNALEKSLESRNVNICAVLFVLYLGIRTGILEVAPLATKQIFDDGQVARHWYEPSTLPFAAIFISDVLMAAPNAWAMARFGYRTCFIAGGCIAATGCTLSGCVLLYAEHCPSLLAYWLLGACGLIIGPFSMTEFARFAAASACPDNAVAAMGRVVAGAFLSSVVGPGLVSLGSVFGRHSSVLRRYAYFYFSSVVLCLIYVACAACLRLPPRSLDAARATGSRREIFRRRNIQVAVSTSFGAQWYMVLLMTATPVAMSKYLNLSGATWEVSTVIGLHMLGMFATGFVSGAYHARVGTMAMMVTGWAVSAAGILFAFLIHHISGYAATLSLFYLALYTIGVGWHFAFIGASKLLLENHDKSEQALVQGGNEQLRFVANTAAILLAGSLDWPVVTYLTAPVLLAIVLFGAWRRGGEAV